MKVVDLIKVMIYGDKKLIFRRRFSEEHLPYDTLLQRARMHDEEIYLIDVKEDAVEIVLL